MGIHAIAGCLTVTDHLIIEIEYLFRGLRRGGGGIARLFRGFSGILFTSEEPHNPVLLPTTPICFLSLSKSGVGEKAGGKRVVNLRHYLYVITHYRLPLSCSPPLPRRLSCCRSG